MQIKLLCVGKTDDAWLRDGISIYKQRLGHYVSFDMVELIPPKKWNTLPANIQKEKEAELMRPHMDKSDMVIALDERGKQLRSIDFADFLQRQMNRSVKNMLFIIGGPWGFSSKITDAAHMQLSLSPMTFSHQMIRLFFTEQLYRAMTILRNESYHNE